MIGCPDYLTDHYWRVKARQAEEELVRPRHASPRRGSSRATTASELAAELAAEWGVTRDEVVDIALHEAAHAAAAYIWGAKIRSIELHPGGGRTEFDPPNEQVRALVAAAGYVAEPYRDGRAYESDRAEVEATGQRWDGAVAEVEAMFTWPGMVRATSNLAGHLLYHRKMSGAEFEALMGRGRG